MSLHPALVIYFYSKILTGYGPRKTNIVCVAIVLCVLCVFLWFGNGNCINEHNRNTSHCTDGNVPRSWSIDSGPGEIMLTGQSSHLEIHNENDTCS
jgi:hypothetical protein